MELNTAVNFSPLRDATNGNLLRILQNNDNPQEKSEVDNNLKVDSGFPSKRVDIEDSSVSVLNGEYCGLATQHSIEYVDIFEILRAEVLAAEAGEFEVIENKLLSTDGSKEEFENGENRKESTSRSAAVIEGHELDNGKNEEESTSTSSVVIDKHVDRCSCENQVLQDRATLASHFSLGQDVEPRQGDGLDSPKLGSLLAQPQANEENGQVQVETVTADCRDVEGACPHKGTVDPLMNGKYKGGDECMQMAEGKGVDNFKAVSQEDDKDGVWQHEENVSQGGETALFIEKGSSNILVVEVIGDAYPRDAGDTGIGKRNVEPSDNGKGEDGDGLSQSDKHSEHSEDEENAPGPIAFSGMLSCSGMISYSGQIPYSGNLSLHSDSSASTRSFAFPILASEWNSSPAKIGPPDSRYFRRRRRWRPRFCCRRPTTLFD